MTAQKGKDLLLKVDTNGSGDAALAVTDPAFDPATQVRSGPVDTVGKDSVSRAWTVRAMTADELDGKGAAQPREPRQGIGREAGGNRCPVPGGAEGAALMLAVTQLVGFGAARRNPPVMRSRATYVAASSLSSHPVTLPAGIEPGDLLLLFGTNIGATDISSMAGWSPLFNDSSSQSRNVHLACFYRIADGSEGSTASVAMSAATSSFMALTFCIKDGKAPVAATSAAGQGATSDPPAVASPAGAVPTLFLAVSQFTEAANNLSSYPSGYENGQWQNNTNGNSKMASAERTATLSSENPGVFTWSGSGSWIANTVAVAAA